VTTIPLLARITRAGEVVTYGALTLLGVVAAVIGQGYGLLLANGQVGPGMVPTVSGALLAVLGAVLLLRAVREHRTSPPPPVDRESRDIFGRTEPERVRHLWLVFGLLLAAIFAVSLLGFLVSFGAFVLVVSTWVERRRLLSSLAITVGAVAFIYLVFVVFLRVPLPQGLLGV
jgi:putative tricarboxylic transport membrane protein